jgi:hypothetical protein
MQRVLLAIVCTLCFVHAAHADIRGDWAKPTAQSETHVESNTGPRWLWIAGGSAIGAVLAALGLLVLRAKRK